MDCLLFSFIPIVKGNFFTIKENNSAINVNVLSPWNVTDMQCSMSEHLCLYGHLGPVRWPRGKVRAVQAGQPELNPRNLQKGGGENELHKAALGPLRARSSKSPPQ